MTIYDEMQSFARDILRSELGQASASGNGIIQLIKMVRNGPADNPGPAVPQIIDLPGAVARGVSFKYVQKGLADATDIQVTSDMLESGVIGEQGDFIKINSGQPLKIHQRVQLPAAGVPVAYVYIIRK